MYLYGLIFLAAILNGIAQILWKKSNINPEGIRSFMTNYLFIGGATLYVVSIFIRVIALQKIDVSKAYPILALSYIVVLLGGYYLGEHISSSKIVGVSLIISGVFIIMRS